MGAFFNVSCSSICDVHKLTLNIPPVRSPQGATILRPPSFPLCEPLAPAFTSGYAVIPKSHVPILACLMTWHMIAKGGAVTDIKPPQRLRGKSKKMWSQCLEWNVTASMLQPTECKEFPHPPEQLFVQDVEEKWFRYIGDIRTKRHEIVPLSNADVEILKSGNWVAEKFEIYSTVGQLPVT